MQIHQWIIYLWYAIGIVWLAWALFAKKVVRAQSLLSRLVYVFLFGGLYYVLCLSPLGTGPLALRIVPDTPAFGWAGLALTALGVLFAVWARLVIAGNWSAAVTIKQDHELVRRGPYALVRHPIYTGILTSILGTAIAFGEVRYFVALLVAIISYRIKIGMEERFLEDQFGAAYSAYRRDVRALIPFVL